jgi:YrbI family 3-deoxy-D-manno-octulosonate 8-phosphate phosphatase
MKVAGEEMLAEPFDGPSTGSGTTPTGSPSSDEHVIKVVAVIPARGGSKGVPGKNLSQVGGRSLVVRAVDSCRSTASIDAVYVSTDDRVIAQAAERAGASVITRPAALAGDTATSESALMHSLQEIQDSGVSPEVLVFVQCTSPFIDAVDLDRAVGLVRHGAADSTFSAVATYEFLWRARPGGTVAGVNHHADHRPRRQDREPDYRETGAFYVMDVPGFRTAGHRFFGRTVAVEVPQITAVDIDHLQDLALARALAETLDPRTGVDLDVLITDFDGVHTDDAAYIDQDGRETVRVSRADGLGIERLRAAGVPLLIVSKETNPVVRARAAKLGVEVLHGVEHKAAVVGDWLAAKGIPPERAGYLGNDLNDLGPMAVVGWPVAVADAKPEVRQAARLVLSHAGGAGAVRELCDLIIEERVRRGDDRTRRPAAAVGADAAPALAPIR